MDKLNLMTSFIAVAEAGSFTAGARQLGKTKALVSTHITQLEKWLQIRLIVRSTRSMKLTAEGQSYYEQAKRILDDISTLEADLLFQNQSLVGRLRIAAPTTFGEIVLMPYIGKMIADNPELNIELALNDRYVDLIDEGFDMAIRIGNLEDSNLIARRARNGKMIICAAPSFIDQHGLPETPQQLERLPCVFDSNMREGSGWSFSKNEKLIAIKPKFVASVNSALAAANMARNGIVIANCPDFSVQTMIDQGELIPLFESYDQPVVPVNIIYPHRQHLSAKVKSFADGLISYLTPAV